MQVDCFKHLTLYLDKTKNQVHKERGQRHIPDGGAPAGVKLFSFFLFDLHPQVVNIYFNAGSFDKVTRSAKTNFVSQLSLIGGTFGLFTGFSILSGIEIIYFLIKVNFPEFIILSN